MPGVKRDHDGIEQALQSNVSPYIPMFEAFRDDLDEHHDRRERIIKASRDITAASKKIVRSLKAEIPLKISSEIQERSSLIQKQLHCIVPDLAGINRWRYQRQITPGIQEYMEAISLEHYLRHQNLISVDEALRSLPAGIDLSADDYLLGLFDLVGELMRFAITTMATTGSLPGSSDSATSSMERDMLMDMRSLRISFQALDTSSCQSTPLAKDLEKKVEVMSTCVEKVENAVYGMIIRGREKPQGWIPDLADERTPVGGY